MSAWVKNYKSVSGVPLLENREKSVQSHAPLPRLKSNGKFAKSSSVTRSSCGSCFRWIFYCCICLMLKSIFHLCWKKSITNTDCIGINWQGRHNFWYFVLLFIRWSETIFQHDTSMIFLPISDHFLWELSQAHRLAYYFVLLESWTKTKIFTTKTKDKATSNIK